MVKNQVREQIGQMRFNEARQPQQQHPAQNRQGQRFPATKLDAYVNGYERQQPGRPASPVKRFAPPPANIETPRMSGPSMTEADIMRMMESKFIDATIAGDDPSEASQASQASQISKASKASQTSKASDGKLESTTQDAPRKRGRAKRNPPVPDEKTDVGQTVATDTIVEPEDTEKIITVTAPLPAPRGPRGGAVKRPRGRPPKNANQEANVITLDRL
jgi:hypothetical protein